MKNFQQIAVWLVFGLVFIFMAGCAPSIPTYPGMVDNDSMQMTSFQKYGGDFMVPKGWEYTPPKGDQTKTVMGTWKSEGKVLLVTCNPYLIKESDLYDAAHDIINATYPTNNLIKGPYLIETADKKASQPIFEAYAAKGVAEGQSVDMIALLGYKMPTGWGTGCRYIVFGTTTLDKKDQFEKEFIATLKTLKN